MYGVFLALLLTNLIPKQVRDNLLKSIGIFIGYNLIYGMRSGVDNAAHVGGLVSGFAIGYGYFLTMKKEREGQKQPAIILVVAAATVIATYLFLQKNETGNRDRNETLQALNESKYKDGEIFFEKLNSFSEYENRALAPFNDTAQFLDESLIRRLEENSLPEWNKAEQVVEEMKSFDVSENSKKKIELLSQYIQLRKEEIAAIKKDILEKTVDGNLQLNEVRNKINKLIEEINGL